MKFLLSFIFSIHLLPYLTAELPVKPVDDLIQDPDLYEINNAPSSAKPSREVQYEALRSFSPNPDDVKYNAVSFILQKIKKEISDADPTLAPVRELRRIFFETLIGPVQKFETEFNDILSDFVLLREQFKEYIEEFLEFNSVCTAYLENFNGADTCFEYIPKLIRYIERMEDILNRIINSNDFDKRLHVIVKIVSSENSRMQDLETNRYKEYEDQWIKIFSSLDLRGVPEAKEQLLKMDSFLLAFSESFNKFRSVLKRAKSYLWEAHQATTLESRISTYESSLTNEGLEYLVNFLWDTNYKCYGLMKIMAQPDPTDILIKLPRKTL